jgi:hypothetical protein
VVPAPTRLGAGRAAPRTEHGVDGGHAVVELRLLLGAPLAPARGALVIEVVFLTGLRVVHAPHRAQRQRGTRRVGRGRSRLARCSANKGS